MYRRVAVAVVLGFLCVLGLLGLVRFGSVLALLEVFQFLADKLAAVTGWSPWITRAIALPLVGLLAWNVSCLFSLRKERRSFGYGLFFGLASLMCLAMFALTRGAYFDYQTGQPQKWYATAPEGFRVFDQAGWDPKYGVPLQPVTPQVRRQIALWELEPGQLKVAPGQEERYFDMITGAPIQWYYKLPDGSLEFFAKPGVHPKYGESLMAVTTEIVRREEGRRKKAAETRHSNATTVNDARALEDPLLIELGLREVAFRYVVTSGEALLQTQVEYARAVRSVDEEISRAQVFLERGETAGQGGLAQVANVRSILDDLRHHREVLIRPDLSILGKIRDVGMQRPDRDFQEHRKELGYLLPLAESGRRLAALNLLKKCFDLAAAFDAEIVSFARVAETVEPKDLFSESTTSKMHEHLEQEKKILEEFAGCLEATKKAFADARATQP